MTIQHAIAQLLERQSLSHAQMQTIMQQVMGGECSHAQIAGFLIALRMNGETVEEITAAAQVMTSLAEQVQVQASHLIDIVGTGGDGSSTFNVSTAAAFVAAGAGTHVAKHGNRSVSSQSGSADCLEQCGANLNLNAAQVAQVIEQTGVGFMFAPMHHSAMKHAITARKEMAVRTIFNVLGPLTNPARVKRQVVGVYAADMTTTLAQVFANLGSEHTLVVHSEDGLDEISLSAPTRIAEMQSTTEQQSINNYRIQPEDFGLRRAPLSEIMVTSPQASTAMLKAVLDGQAGAARDIVLLNAGAGIYVSGIADSLSDGVERAAASIDSGQAKAAMQNYVNATQGFAHHA